MSFKKAWKKARDGKIVMRQIGSGFKRYLIISPAGNVRIRSIFEKVPGIEREDLLCVDDLCSKEWVIIVPPKTIDDIKCDRCGKPAEFNEGGGNCPECGADLCFDCGQWSADEDDGRCGQCQNGSSNNKQEIKKEN